MHSKGSVEVLRGILEKLEEIHFRGYPSNILIPCEGEDYVKWNFVNSLKESDQEDLWSSVMNGTSGYCRSSIILATAILLVVTLIATTKLEYGRDRGISGGALKCVEIGKNTNGESTLLGRH